MHGEGEYKWPDGDVYTGEFRRGLRHGQGKFVTNYGLTYEGTWFEKLRSGQAIITFKGKSDGPNDKWRYEGLVNNCQPHGPGELTLNDGTKYQGMWRFGKENGRMTVTKNTDTWKEHWCNGQFVKRFAWKKTDKPPMSWA